MTRLTPCSHVHLCVEGYVAKGQHQNPAANNTAAPTVNEHVSKYRRPPGNVLPVNLVVSKGDVYTDTFYERKGWDLLYVRSFILYHSALHLECH